VQRDEVLGKNIGGATADWLLFSAPRIEKQDTNTNHPILHIAMWRLALEDQLVPWSDYFACQ
jgi:hypothetical protein